MAVVSAAELPTLAGRWTAPSGEMILIDAAWDTTNVHAGWGERAAS